MVNFQWVIYSVSSDVQYYLLLMSLQYIYLQCIEQSKWILLTIMLEYLFNPVILIYYALSFNFWQTIILAYLYDSMIYIYTWCTTKRYQWRFTTDILAYWFIYVNQVISVYIGVIDWIKW